MKHIIVIPYYCRAEVRRYLWIANYLRSTVIPDETQFILCESRTYGHSNELFEAFSRLGHTTSYACVTHATGHDAESTAKFWEIMHYVAFIDEHDGGFVLWLESDMVPIRTDWIKRLAEEWMSHPHAILMGLYVDKFSHRACGPVPAHINGGACYSKDFINYVPPEARKPIFDVSLFPHVSQTRRYICSDAFTFSCVKNLMQHFNSPKTVILHGLFQNQDEFVKRCIEMAVSRSKIKKWKWLMQEIWWTISFKKCCKCMQWEIFRPYCPVHSRIK